MRIFPWMMCALLYSSMGSALPTVVPDPVPCVIELETHFFTELIVNQALSLYNVRQELWLSINEGLQQRNLEVPERMKRRTAFMVPNPIEYPMQRAATAKILKEVLSEVLYEVLRENYIFDQAVATLIFDYIFTQQLPNFVRCFGPAAKQLQPNF